MEDKANTYLSSKLLKKMKMYIFFHITQNHLRFLRKTQKE